MRNSLGSTLFLGISLMGILACSEAPVSQTQAPAALSAATQPSNANAPDSSAVQEGASRYQAGVHYQVIGEEATGQNEVREYFSFYCPHCFHFEQVMASLKPALEDELVVRNHVTFMRGIPKDAQFTLSKALVLAQMLEDKSQQQAVIKSIFDTIHVKNFREKTYELAGVRDLFKANGVDGDWFDSQINAPATIAAATAMQRNEHDAFGPGKLTGVPSVVVNGKYQVKMVELDPQDPMGDYIKRVKFLLTNP